MTDSSVEYTLMHFSKIRCFIVNHGWIIGWVLLIALLRWQWLDISLERDEGEYAYIGQLLLQGIEPFKEVATLKLPGTPLMYALFMAIGGENIQAIHTGLLVCSLLSMLLLYALGSQLFNRRVGWIAAAFYGSLGMLPYFLGFAAHASHFVVLFVLLGMVAGMWYLRDRRGYRALFMGICFGMAILMKQHAFLFPFLGALLIYQGIDIQLSPVTYARRWLHLILLGGGVLMPYLVLVGWVFATGGFTIFFKWTILYAARYATGSSSLFSFPQVLFCIVGILILLKTQAYLQATDREQRARLVCWHFFFLAFAATSLGMVFRSHYLIQLLPPLALIIGKELDIIFTYMAQNYPVRGGRLLPVFTAGLFAFSLTANILFVSPETVLLRSYGYQYFENSQNIAKIIQQFTDENERFAVIGSEPQLYFFSQRRSVTPYIYTYAMMETHPYARPMQDDMIASIEAYQPRIIIRVLLDTSWLMRPTSDRHILDWADHYLKAHYTLVGVYDAVKDPAGAVHRVEWHRTRNTPTPPSYSSRALLIYQRN